MSNKKGGGSNIIADAISWVIAVGILIAIVMTNGDKLLSSNGLLDWSRLKSKEMKECYTNPDCLKIKGGNLKGKEIPKPNIDGKVKMPNIDGDVKFPNLDGKNLVKGKKNNIGEFSANNLSDIFGSYDDLSKKLDGIVIDKPQKVDYNRKEWRHWISAGSSCWNTREEVLFRDAQENSLLMLDKSKKETKEKEEACYVIGGEWIDPYSRDVITDPKKIDIDHVIPLGYVAKHGGQDWDFEKKKAYANDYEGLLAVSATENRSKSDKGPEEYMPPNKEFHCGYAQQFIHMAYKYNISITAGDQKVLKKALNTCKP